MYDLIVIGGGPGGYIAAARAGARGGKVLLIEKEERLGGVCLNRGCIPTKALLNSAKIYHKSQNSSQLGVSVSGATYNLEKAMDWKAKVVARLTKGVAYQMKRNNVTVVHGFAKIKERNTVVANDREYRCNNLIIATGSSPASLAIPGSNSDHVLTSDEILEIEQLPQKLVIVGGGFIGLEFASYFSMFGTSVTVIEMLPEILPDLDRDLSSQLRKSMPECTFITAARVEEIDQTHLYYSKNGERYNCEADTVLIAVGRIPNTKGIGLENIDLDVNRKGISVNEKMQTNIPNIYAVGDVTGKSLLAHAAHRMGEVAVNVMLGDDDRMRYHAIPWIVYSNPEIACVGITEEQAKRENREIKVATLQLQANGRFVAEHGSEKGLCKVIVDAQSDALIGVAIIGGSNSEIIYGAAAMIEAELRVKDIREIVFPHPTVSEIIKDTLWELN